MRLLKLQIPACLIFAVWALSVPDVHALQNTKEPKTIKIGLLIPANNSLEARQGAEIAIRKANKSGGYNNLSFQLIVRSMEGPWGKGSKEAVNMIFEENVWAIVGSNDGRNGHIVEQVATKARIVFLSAWATDPSLSQAFVPWYFCCVPNDLQQASALIEEIYNKRKFNKVAVVSENNFDSKLAITSFMKKTKTAGKPDPLQFRYENTSQNFNDLLNQINKANIDCIILFGQSSSSMKLIQQMRSKKMNQPVFGTIALQDENQLSGQNLKNFESVVLVSSEHWFSPKGLAFREEYQRTYGNMPGPAAAYAYDGIYLIIEAIRMTGLDRDRIQKSLTEIIFEGVTGIIQFDDKGNRLGAPGLMEIKDGIPVDIEK